VRLLATLIGITAISGAFVAGRQAGMAYNTFPLMEGHLIPDDYFELRPLYRNFFESIATVQLHHRALALTTVSSAAALWASAQALPLPPQVRLAVDLLAIGSAAQLSLGVATVVHCVPVELGSAHQAGALTLFSLMIFALHSCRVPHATTQLVARWGQRRLAHG
jgi:cytochrome c oxidase assembly protein subunit 15